MDVGMVSIPGRGGISGGLNRVNKSHASTTHPFKGQRLDDFRQEKRENQKKVTNRATRASEMK